MSGHDTTGVQEGRPGESWGGPHHSGRLRFRGEITIGQADGSTTPTVFFHGVDIANPGCHIRRVLVRVGPSILTLGDDGFWYWEPDNV